MRRLGQMEQLRSSSMRGSMRRRYLTRQYRTNRSYQRNWHSRGSNVRRCGNDRLNRGSGTLGWLGRSILRKRDPLWAMGGEQNDNSQNDRAETHTKHRGSRTEIAVARDKAFNSRGELRSAASDACRQQLTTARQTEL